MSFPNLISKQKGGVRWGVIDLEETGWPEASTNGGRSVYVVKWGWKTSQMRPQEERRFWGIGCALGNKITRRENSEVVPAKVGLLSRPLVGRARKAGGCRIFNGGVVRD